MMSLKKGNQERHEPNSKFDVDNIQSFELPQTCSTEIDFDQTINEIEEAVKDIKKTVKIKKQSLGMSLSNASFTSRHPFIKMIFPKSFIIGFIV